MKDSGQKFHIIIYSLFIKILLLTVTATTEWNQHVTMWTISIAMLEFILFFCLTILHRYDECGLRFFIFCLFDINRFITMLVFVVNHTKSVHSFDFLLDGHAGLYAVQFQPYTPPFLPISQSVYASRFCAPQ